MKSLANRPTVFQVLITLACLTVGIFLGSSVGLLSLPAQEKQEVVPTYTIDEELGWDHLRLVPIPQSECQRRDPIGEQLRSLERLHSSMEEIESEIMIERLESLEKSIRELERYHQEPH